MGFIALLLLLLALSKLAFSMPTGSALDLRDVNTNSSDTALLPSEKCGKKARIKHHMMCKRNPKSCKKFSKHHSCCFHRIWVNLYSNRLHCGSCGHICAHGMKCCKGVCVDVRKDINHCGKCRNACFSDESCVFGMCGYG